MSHAAKANELRRSRLVAQMIESEAWGFLMEFAIQGYQETWIDTAMEEDVSREALWWGVKAINDLQTTAEFMVANIPVLEAELKGEE